jgi:hypothetical protein
MWSSRPSMLLLLSSHPLMLSPCTEKIVLHSLILFLMMTAWVSINPILPEEKVRKIPISKRGGEIPTFRKHNSTLFSFNLFFFCMRAIHSGIVVLKTKLHLVYVLLFVDLQSQKNMHAIMEVWPSDRTFVVETYIFRHHIA